MNKMRPPHPVNPVNPVNPVILSNPPPSHSLRASVANLSPSPTIVMHSLGRLIARGGRSKPGEDRYNRNSRPGFTARHLAEIIELLAHPLSLDDLAQLCVQACLMEATARKPGNVHPGARFNDLYYDDFVQSAKSAAPHLARAGVHGVGRAVRDAVHATRERVNTNTNLGIALLIAPLAAVPLDQPLQAGIAGVLQTLTPLDAEYVYEAIRLARPAGLGSVPDGDVAAAAPPDLLWSMQHAADRDWIARQYTTAFRDLLDTAVPILAEWRPDAGWEVRVIHLHLELMACWPDTLIARKCGGEVATESARRAREVLDSGWPDSPAGQGALDEFDAWLRADGHRRNPGTTADAVAATLFATLRDRLASFPDWVWAG